MLKFKIQNEFCKKNSKPTRIDEIASFVCQMKKLFYPMTLYNLYFDVLAPAIENPHRKLSLKKKHTFLISQLDRGYYCEREYQLENISQPPCKNQEYWNEYRTQFEAKGRFVSSIGYLGALDRGTKDLQEYEFNPASDLTSVFSSELNASGYKDYVTLLAGIRIDLELQNYQPKGKICIQKIEKTLETIDEDGRDCEPQILA